MFISCKPYDKPEYVFVNSNETAFVIPQFLDSGANTSDQVQVNSEAYFTKNIVNERTIQVPHRWIKTGRFEGDGKYVPTVKVVKVSQTPIAGEWLPKTSGADSKTAVRLETIESSGFQLPMRYTMHIEAADAAKYLANWTTDKPLQEVIDTTVNTWITAELNKEFHKLPYTLVSTKRDEIVANVAEKAKTEFLSKGITIDVLAAYDGIYWDDSSIQQEIDKQVAAKAAQNTKDEELKVAQKQKLIDERAIYDALPKRGAIWAHLFYYNYANYCKNQENRTPEFQKFMLVLKDKDPNMEDVPSDIRERFLVGSRPLMKYTNILTFNVRAICIYVTCLLNCPWVYMLIEITILNILYIYMHKQHESLCKSLSYKI